MIENEENFYIQRWDDNHCASHVEPYLVHISNILNEYFKNNSIIFIDIGANVGKVYDIIKSKNILNIKHAYLFEASNRLYRYMINKYKNNNEIDIYNDIILDVESLVNFDDDYIYNEILNKNSYINFGLSKINNYRENNKRSSLKISNFIKHKKLLNDYVFIKIDTENSDFFILNDILSILDEFALKPVIEFEINYTASILTIDDAQLILNKYHKNYNYNKIDLAISTGDGLLVPQNHE